MLTTADSFKSTKELLLCLGLEVKTVADNSSVSSIA